MMENADSMHNNVGPIFDDLCNPKQATRKYAMVQLHNYVCQIRILVGIKKVRLLGRCPWIIDPFGTDLHFVGQVAGGGRAEFNRSGKVADFGTDARGYPGHRYKNLCCCSY